MNKSTDVYSSTEVAWWNHYRGAEVSVLEVEGRTCLIVQMTDRSYASASDTTSLNISVNHVSWKITPHNPAIRLL